MNDLYLIITISGIHFLALISPGPDFIMVLKNSIQYSRKIGIFTSIGISLGIIVHLFYCITGLALILSTNDFILNLFKFLCSGYLIYIGMKSFQIRGGGVAPAPLVWNEIEFIFYEIKNKK